MNTSSSSSTSESTQPRPMQQEMEKKLQSQTQTSQLNVRPMGQSMGQSMGQGMPQGAFSIPQMQFSQQMLFQAMRNQQGMKMGNMQPDPKAWGMMPKGGGFSGFPQGFVRTGMPQAMQGVPFTPQVPKREDEDKSSSQKDLTDAIRLAGIDIKQETANFLKETQETSPPEETEPTFLANAPLKRKILDIAEKSGIKKVQDEVYQYVTTATQEYLRGILETLRNVARQRNDFAREQFHTRVSFDPKNALKTIEREEERKRKLSAEREDPSKRIKTEARIKPIVFSSQFVVNPVVFTQQHLSQLQLLQPLAAQKKLTPEQQQLYQVLRTQLADRKSVV